MVKKHQVLCYGCALAVFIIGCALWFQAYYYQPQTPRRDFPRRFVYREAAAAFSGDRYQALQKGELFFGKQVVPAAPAPAVVKDSVPFQSQLILWGITGGEDCRAVVGADPKSNQQTEILKAGDEYAGETIETIGPDYIVVRNSTGTGRVYIGGEAPQE